MRPICVPCCRFMRPKKSGYPFIEGMPGPGHDGQRGKDAAGWKPYKFWLGDLYECEGCHTQVVSGVGFQPLAEHYQEERFAEMREFYQSRYPELLFVKDR